MRLLEVWWYRVEDLKSGKCKARVLVERGRWDGRAVTGSICKGRWVETLGVLVLCVGFKESEAKVSARHQL